MLILSMIRDVTDLEVYILALELLEPLYKLTNQLPSNHRRLKYQANEAGEKIAPIIAEGFGKKEVAQRILQIFVNGTRFFR